MKTGYALDNKTPLLKALSAVDGAATSVCQYFGKNITKERHLGMGAGVLPGGQGAVRRPS